MRTLGGVCKKTDGMLKLLSGASKGLPKYLFDLNDYRQTGI